MSQDTREAADPFLPQEATSPGPKQVIVQFRRTNQNFQLEPYRIERQNRKSQMTPEGFLKKRALVSKFAHTKSSMHF
jgi:hypothetical protein